MARGRVNWAKTGLAFGGVAAALLVIGGLAMARTGDDAVPKITDPAVERVFPRQGDLVLRQSQIGIDLAAGYRGVLIIDGVEIPTHDLVGADPAAGTQPALEGDAQFDPAQNTVVFTPTQGAAIEQLEPGDHTVVAVFWKQDETRDQARTYLWHFKVS